MKDEPQPLDELLSVAESTSDAAGKRGLRLPLKQVVIFAVVAAVSLAAAYAAAGLLTSQPTQPEPLLDEQAMPAVSAPKKELNSAERIIFPMDSIIVNVHGTEARRFMKATIAFSLKDHDVQKSMEANKLILTDRLILVLSSKKIQDVDGYEQKEDLKREIRDEVNALLGFRDGVTQVYFTDLIIQ